MAHENLSHGTQPEVIGVNPGYAAFQLAKALTTQQGHTDPATRVRAQEKIEKWEAVLRQIVAGSVNFGSRTPVADTPAWATLEVVTGGFATGELDVGKAMTAIVIQHSPVTVVACPGAWYNQSAAPEVISEGGSETRVGNHFLIPTSW
jgi:hypothetical protein